MRPTRTLLFSVFLASLLLGTMLCWAQLPAPAFGAFSGTIRDEQGQPLPGARVTIRSLETTRVRETQTNDGGHFFYGGFPPGRYLITVHRGDQLIWSFPVRLPPGQEVIRLEIDLKKLREALEQMQRLDPELERQREADRQRRKDQQRLQAHYTRGVRRLEEGHPEEALEEFQAAREMEPDRGLVYAMLGAASAAAQRQSEAIDFYRHALELEPNEAAHHNNLGTVLARVGQLEEALRHFERAAQLDPDRAATYYFNRGAALFNAGRFESAVAALREATRRDPTLAVSHYFLGLALYRLSPRHPVGQGSARIEPRPGTIEAFQRYLQLAPEGEFAESAREYLEQLGVLSPDMLLPPVPSTEPFY